MKNMRVRPLQIILGSVFSVCLGCSSEGTPSSSGTANVSGDAETAVANTSSAILSVEVEPEHVVTFYEVPGAGVLMLESRTQSQTSVLKEAAGATPLQVFQKLRPSEATPAALLDAAARAERTAVDVGALPTTSSAVTFGGGAPLPEQVTPLKTTDGVGAIRQATSSSSAAHFIDDHQACDVNGARATIARVNWGGGFWAAWNPAASATCQVDHYSGNGITVQLTAGSTVLSFSQAVNTLQTYSWGLVSGNILRRIDILNASGDAFHVACSFF